MSGQIEHLTLSSIVVREGRRKLHQETVDGLVTSFKEVGLLNPITVWRPKDGQVTLVAGGHRLAAAHQLEWESIPCYVILDGEGPDSVDAKIAEIDENLIRSDLSPAERADFTYRRKQLHEIKHPETLHGGKGGWTKRTKLEVAKTATSRSKPAERFTKDVSNKTGRPERTVQLDAARGKNLSGVLSSIIGTSLDKGEELDALGKLSPEKQKELAESAKSGNKVSAKTELKKEKRAEKEVDLAQKIADLPDEKYGVILADPEWKFKVYSEETGMDRSADNHYPTSALEEIKARDVGSIAADHCVLFLWATVPMLPQALEVMEAWGFEYKSHVAWAKDRVGTGYWFRNKHELLLVGTKGSPPAPAPGLQWPSLIEAPVGEHSAKPEVFLELIESYFPNLPRIELNRRGLPREGWSGWGLECEAAALEAAE